MVNSVKIDGDGEASDFEKDVVENDFILSKDKTNNSELSAPGLLQRMTLQGKGSIHNLTVTIFKKYVITK